MNGVSPNAEIYLKKDAPKNIRLMAAKGAVPLLPADLLIVLFHLTQDNDPEVAREAKNSLDITPRNILKNVLSSDLPTPLLDYFSDIKKDDPEIMEVIILNKKTSDQSIAKIVRSSNPKLLEIVSHNQERMMRSAEILNNLLENPYLSQVSRDRLLEFFSARMPELLKEKEAELPQDVTAELPQEVKVELPKAFEAVELPPELIDDGKEPLTEQEHKNLYQNIQKMTASAKIKLALLGNKEARNILIRDANKLVAAAVVKSPKVTESEIAMVSQSRNVSEEVLRIISSNKEWMKNYQIKLSIVSNPKTPLPIAMKYLSSLKGNDLKQLSLSRNISAAVASSAKRLISGKG